MRALVIIALLLVVSGCRSIEVKQPCHRHDYGVKLLPGFVKFLPDYRIMSHHRYDQ